MNRPPVNPLVSRALEIAEKRLGIEELGLRLKVAEEVITAWRHGRSTMSTLKFLQLVDILADVQPSWNEWNP